MRRKIVEKAHEKSMIFRRSQKLRFCAKPQVLIMKRETKKQLFTIFVLLMFMGSSIAFAVSSVLQRVQPSAEQTLVFDRPLTDSESARFLDNNIVVADFYYSQNCAGCSAAESVITALVQELSGYLVVDKIDAEKYKSMAEANEIPGLPAFVLKGTTIDIVSGMISKEDLKNRICQLYAEPINACG